MNSLLTLGLVALDMTGTLRTVGLVGGIIMLVIWLVSIKNTTALFHDKKKIRATVMFGVPGLILLVMGIFMFISMKPMSSNIYVSNYSPKEGKIVVDGNEHVIASGSWEKIEVRSKEENYSIKGYLGDSIVFDTTMGDGSWIGSLSDDKYPFAEEVEYSALSIGGSDDLVYEILMDPGVARFSTDVITDLYDFDNDSPSSMSVSSYSSKVRKFDLGLMTQAEMFKMMIDAMGEDEGGEEGDVEEEDVEEEEVEVEEGE